jgi:hypothetical protein
VRGRVSIVLSEWRRVSVSIQPPRAAQPRPTKKIPARDTMSLDRAYLVSFIYSAVELLSKFRELQ